MKYEFEYSGQQPILGEILIYEKFSLGCLMSPGRGLVIAHSMNYIKIKFRTFTDDHVQLTKFEK